VDFVTHARVSSEVSDGCLWPAHSVGSRPAFQGPLGKDYPDA